MNPGHDRIRRILILHPEAETRSALEEGLRRVAGGGVSVYRAGSPAEGLDGARRLDPQVVFLDLSAEPALALDVARQLRRHGRLVVGLYNPLLLQRGEGEFFRRAIRSGVDDFVPLPAAEDELRTVLGTAGQAPDSASAGVSEGRTVSFISATGGVGTTTLALGVALTLAEAGAVDREVVLCDAALPFGGVTPVLETAPDRDLADLVRELDDPGPLATYLLEEPQSGLRVLASPRQMHDALRITPEDLSRVLIALRRRFGLVVVDSPRALDLFALAVLDLSETIVVVTEAKAPAILATGRLLALLEEQGFGERLRLVVNQTAPFDGVQARVVVEQLGREVDHVLLYDRDIPSAGQGAAHVLQRRKSDFSRAIRRLAAALSREGEDVELEVGRRP